MLELIAIIFVIGYAAIAFEHPIQVNKAASAILTGVLCWTAYVIGSAAIVDISSHEYLNYAAEAKGDISAFGFISGQLTHHLGEISGILFFLLGAMTIVELIDLHNGFDVITSRIRTTDKVHLLWIVGIITFFLSALLDNLTTSIVMVSLLRKLIKSRKGRMFYAGIVVVAANAGGAWSPIGDVTTTMLWIGGQITTLNIVSQLIIPSIVCMVVPLIYLSFRLKGVFARPESIIEAHHEANTTFEKKLVLGLGVAALVFVPVFKSITHLPPFMGMLLGLGVLWVVTERMHKGKSEEARKSFSVISALRKIDTSSVLFFLGILVAISALESTRQLHHLAQLLDSWIGNADVIVIAIGLLSAIVDNVPLVAAAMGMYDYPTDHRFWEFLAYCAGTGGSALIIGSAAGVAVMGIEKIDFIWYLKKISLFALIGYFAGAICFLLLKAFVF